MRSVSVSCNRVARYALFCFGVWAAVALPAWGVILSSGNGNTDGSSLTAAGGPGNPLMPGFANVGTSSTGNASVTYLGNRWVLTAGHNTIGSSTGPVRFGGVPYTVDDSSITFLHNPDNTLADLKLFQITTDPGLPAITPDLISSSAPSGRQIMIGNGLDRGDQFYWNVDMQPNPWQWTQQPEPSNPGPNDFSGFQMSLSHHIRWGENEVLNTGLLTLTAFDPQNNPLWVNGYSTEFDDTVYTGVTPLPSEALVSLGDSGGAVFQLEGGQWKLSGIMVAFAELYSGQPQAPAGIPYAVFGNESLIADLSVYRDEIISIVPEPAGLALLSPVVGVMLLVGLRRRR